MKIELTELLKQELIWMQNAAEILDYSYQTCVVIGGKDNLGGEDKFSLAELDHFEALTSRFARLSDIVLQKILRLIDEIDLETQGTVRDRINRAEKKQLIASAEIFVQIRLLRNSIAHEYQPVVIADIFQRVLQFTPELLNAVERIKNYCGKYI
jgi:uncharacterized protein YutE (UPF0331/DUF86 family)